MGQESFERSSRTRLIADDDAESRSYSSIEDENQGYSGAQAWNKPAGNQIKVLVALIEFIVLGLTDSAIGAILPSVEPYYGLNDLQVSILFLVPVIGSLLSALFSGWIHANVGRRGVAILGVSLQLVCYSVAMMAPPFEILLAAFVAAGLGSGLVNGSWNAWIGAFENAHGILGILHGSYALGGMLGPTVVTLLLQMDKPWYYFYRIMCCAAIMVLVAGAIAFRKDNAKAYYIETQRGATPEPQKVDHVEAFKTRTVWILALFLCSYNGIELGYSGWLVTYMIRERHGDPKTMGLMATGFWTGLTVGRVGLGFVTGRFRSLEKVILTYFAAAICFHCVFWYDTLSPVYVSGAYIFAVGVFIGPIFPSAMVMATTVLPKRLHVSGISSAAALSGCGSAVFPVIIGAFVNRYSAGVLLPVIFSSYMVVTTLWVILARRTE
jgi:fucose permease